VASVLVTGATGFIGRIVARDLVRAGHGVRALLRGRDPDVRGRNVLGNDVSVVPGDLADRASLSEAPRGCDAVVHLGAIVDPALHDNEGETYRVNRDATIALAEAARSLGASTFVFVSSIAAMGFRSGRATSATPCHPQTAYGRAKLDAERAITALSSPEFRVVVLRPPTVYGPGERYNFLSFVRAVNDGRFRIIGDGRNVFPLCEAGNLSRAIGAAVEGRVQAGTFLVADSEPYALARIHAAILAALGRRPPRLRVPVAVASALGTLNELLAPFGVPLHLSRSRVRTLTSDIPFDVAPLLAAGVALDAPLEVGIASTIADYRAHGLLP
jgi:nucleoside-diphosphate-sugar epimerase